MLQRNRAVTDEKWVGMSYHKNITFRRVIPNGKNRRSVNLKSSALGHLNPIKFGIARAKESDKLGGFS
jgi:hypothetical protein